MEKYELEKDISVFCVKAKVFPEGIIEAFNKLERLHPSICERPFYGISYKEEDGKIVYKAAVAEAYEGEGKDYGCEIFVITKGIYLAETIINFMKDIEVIPAAFDKLLADPDLDLSFPCIEWYRSDKEVICMVRTILPEN